MFKVLAALLGLAVVGAIFAAIYYAPANHELKEEGEPPFNPAAGEVRTFGLQPSLPGAPVYIRVEVVAGEVDVYLMEKEWAADLPEPHENRLSLDRPFSYLAEHSRTHVNGTFETTFISDGETWMTLVIDNSDNYYDGDAAANETANVRITARFLADEQRSLTLGYIAAVPSILLVVVTLGRQAVRRWRG